MFCEKNTGGGMIEDRRAFIASSSSADAEALSAGRVLTGTGAQPEAARPYRPRRLRNARGLALRPSRDAPLLALLESL